MPGSTASRVAKSPAPQIHRRRTTSTARRPEGVSALHPLLRLQQTVGNRAVARIIQGQHLAVSRRHRRDTTNRAFRRNSSAMRFHIGAGTPRMSRHARVFTPGSKPRSSHATDVLQRDVGVEFQAKNVISQKKGRKKFERTQTKRKPLKQVGGLSMEVDTGSVMEFGTGHYKVWSDLKKDLDAVTAIITDIKGLPKEALDPAKPVSADNPSVFRGFTTDHGKVDVTAEPADFRGKPQTNEEIGLSDFGSLLKENRADVAATVESAAKGVVGKAATPNLTSLMQVLVFHLQMLQRDDPGLVLGSSGKITQPKAFLSLLNKTDYTAMFQSLTANEQKEFTTLVNADPNPIAAAAGASMKDDLFKVGYWGWHPDRSNMRVLIRNGDIVRIQKHISGVKGKGADQDIHTCGDAGVPARYCKTKRRIERVTVGAWLNSMIKPSKRTKKSVSAPLPTYSGTKGGGFSWGLSKPTSPGTFLFEVRNHPGIPIAGWLDFAENRFNVAANCRPGSNLTYDGKKPKPACP